MVGDDDEHRVPEPGFPLRLGDEPADGIVGVFHGSLPGVGIAVHLYPSGRVGVGAVVAGGHDLCKEGMPRTAVGIKYLQAFPEDILVADTPDVGEGHLAVRDVFPVDDLIAVMAEEVAHIVKVAVAAVDELRLVAYARQHAAYGQVSHPVGFPLDDALPCTWRQTERQGFQSPHRPVAGGIEAVEDKASLHEPVQLRREVLPVPVSCEEVGAEAFHGDQDDVRTLCPETVADGLPAVLVQSAQLPVQFHTLLPVQHGVEFVVVQLVALEGDDEVARPVLFQLGDILVVALQTVRAP